MAQVPTGTTFHTVQASDYGASKTTTIVSNATEAVVTSVAHGYANGDVVEISSGWGRLHLRVFEIKSITTDTFVLKGFDTTDTNLFPAGAGIGSVREITAFTQIVQVLDAKSSGGDPKDVEFRYVESDVDTSINDGFSAVKYTLELDADSIGTAGYIAVKGLTSVQTLSCLKMRGRDGARIYIPAKVALNENVQLTGGQVNRVVCAFNGQNQPTRYAAGA
jgi:hypothetical protein